MLSDLSAAIYGLMTVGALLAAESAASESYAETVGAVVITMLVVLARALVRRVRLAPPEGP